MRIYIESTIASSILACPARDLIQTACQQFTRNWRDLKREQPELFSSQIVLDEVAAGKRTMAQRRLESVLGLTLLELTPAAETN